MLKRLRPELPYLAALVGAAGIIFGLLLRKLILFNLGFDYNAHRFFAEELARGVIYRVHLVYQIAAVGLATLVPPLGIVRSMWILTLAYYLILVIILYALLRTGTTRRLLAAIGALILTLVNAITILTWSADNQYFGYIVINATHNPTAVMLKPVALLSFYLALLVFRGTWRFNWRTVAVCALLLGVGLFIKPNFALAFLPALVIVMAYRAAIQRNFTGFRLILVGMLIPTTLLLIIQYVIQFVYVPFEGSQGVGLAPFVTVYIVEPSFWWIALKLVLSIAFPLSVSLLYRKEITGDLGIALAWWTLIFALVQMYLLTEFGVGLRDGNFWWGAQVALFLLFVFTMIRWLKYLKNEPRLWITLFILALHVISGIALYWATLMGPDVPY